MFDFRKQQRPASSPLPRHLLMLVGLAVLMLVVTMWPKRTANEPPPAAKTGEQTGARLGETSGASRPGDGAAQGNREAYFPGVHPDYLESIRDDTVFRGAESDAWFHLLQLLEKSSDQELAAASTGPVGYLQLDRQPDAYRGRLVTVEGIVRKAEPMTAPENAYGIERYYQLWLQPLRTDPELLVLYTLHVPKDFPLGDELDTPASATGFFFKRWAYPSQSGILTAPLLLAKSIVWQPPAPSVPPPPLSEQMMLAVATALGFSLVVVVWVWLRSRRTRIPPRDEKLALDLETLPTETSPDTQPPLDEESGR